MIILTKIIIILAITFYILFFVTGIMVIRDGFDYLSPIGEKVLNIFITILIIIVSIILFLSWIWIIIAII